MISWPGQVTITSEDVACTVVTNRAYDDKCTIQDSKKNIVVTNAFL